MASTIDGEVRHHTENSADVEKGHSEQQPADDVSPPVTEGTANEGAFMSRWRAFERTLVRYNFEARGIQRVLPDQRHDMRQLGFMQILLLWVSINLAANNLTLGMLGPAVFYLSFLDASLLAVFGAVLGSIPVAYIATFGPRSGNRTMVFTRYSMGWWPAKLVVVLTLIVLLGYCILDAVIAGQILSAVSTNGNLSVIVGIVITALITWFVTTFGYSIFHWYERYAWLPQMIVIFILAGVAGPKFDLHANPSEGLDRLTIIGNRLSFFSLCYSAAVTYSCAGADYFVYYPESTPKWKVFCVTVIGLVTSFTLEFIIGIGLASGTASNTDWANAYETSQGALAVEAFRPLGTFGSFCSVILALGLVGNLIPPTYSSGVDFQVLGHAFERVPRFVWNSLGVVIYTVCAIAGREHLAEIFTNFLALMGYWVSIWIAIVLEEHILFRNWRNMGWNWEAWNDPRKLPVGIAALIAFLIGWAGAILCMAQVWYIGPLAALVGEYGGDMGNYVGFTWAGLVYAPLRYFELRRFGR
ncbi:Vitamin B6 transporter [Elasticomyces elasticus]|nr:Vitamin B6 transporter [Elasticomyces elasticus]KAK4975392.1 Vitamin B6 transporter [Elasticomyces elasticus]